MPWGGSGGRAPSIRGFTAPNIRYLCSKKAGGKGENWALGRARCSADAHPAATTTQARTLLKLFLLVHQDQALQCAQVTREGPKDALFASTSHEPMEGGTDLQPWARNSNQGLELLPCTPGGLKMLQTIPVHAKAEQILATPASPPSCPTSTGDALPEGQSRRRGQKHLQQQGHLQEHLQGPGTSPRALRVCPILGQFLCTNNLPGDGTDGLEARDGNQIMQLWYSPGGWDALSLLFLPPLPKMQGCCISQGSSDNQS